MFVLFSLRASDPFLQLLLLLLLLLGSPGLFTNQPRNWLFQSELQSAPSLVFADCIRASPSLAAKNIINLILVLTIWWCPCVEYSPVLLEEGVCYDQCVLLAKLLSFALLHSVLQGEIFQLLQVFLDFLLLHSPFNMFLFALVVFCW